jgi:membrane protein YdbS with pleckstrin-like domain
VKQSFVAGVGRKSVVAELARAGWKPTSYQAVLSKYYGKEKSKKAIPIKVQPQAPSQPVAQALPMQQKITMPAHDYKVPKPSSWPIKKIMESECSKTYADLNFMQQVYAFLPPLLVGVLVLVVVIFLMLANLWLYAFFALFLAAPLFIGLTLEAIYYLDTYRFSLQEEYLFIRAGVVSPTYHLIPYENIQDAQISFDRIFGFTKVFVSTPATSISTFFKKKEDAEKFREDLLSLARMHKNMAE